MTGYGVHQLKNSLLQSVQNPFLFSAKCDKTVPFAMGSFSFIVCTIYFRDPSISHAMVVVGYEDSCHGSQSHSLGA